MYCTKCGLEINDDSRFCSRCGQRTLAGGVMRDETPALMLDKRNKKIAGVCAGFARYFGMDVVLVRVVWLAAGICTGVGFLAYLAAWIVVPSDGGMGARDVMVSVPQTR